MGIIKNRGPKVNLSILIKMFWDSSEPQIVTEDELEQRFPGVQKEDWKFYQVRHLKFDAHHYVAYNCNRCGIVTGTPKIEYVNRDSGMLAGKKGYEYRCSQCNRYLERYGLVKYS